MSDNMISPPAFCLRWNNHNLNLLNVFDDLLERGELTDMSLVSDDGQIIKCHKIVLAASSAYFQRVLATLPDSCTHPMIVLKDVQYTHLRSILEYIYRGEVSVQSEQLTSLLKLAEMLQVKGLVDHRSNADASGEEQSSTHNNDSRRGHEDTEISLSPPPAISTSTNINNIPAHSSGYVSPPHSFGLYGKSFNPTVEINRIQDQISSFWTLNPSCLPMPSTMAHQVSPQSSPITSIFNSAGGSSSSYDNRETIFETAKRMKKMHTVRLPPHRDTPILRTVLGQGHVDSSVTGVPLLQPDSHESHYRANSSGSANDNDNRRSNTDLAHSETAHSSYADVLSMDEDDKQPSPQSHTGDTKSGNTTHAQLKPEWKRYKQYTKEDIQKAIQAVKAGTSAVQAARQYGVPSRTLYDKVKKLGIPTSRPFKRSVSNGNSTACFPYGIGGNVNGRIYNNAMQSENENENKEVFATSTSSASMFDSVYAKPASKDTSQDRDSMSDSMTRYSPSPVIRCAKQKQQQQQSMDDEVEDLSVSRKSDVPVIVQTPSDAIKEESQETGPNNSDCCDYS